MSKDALSPIYGLHQRILETAADHLQRRIYLFGDIDELSAFRFIVAFNQMDHIEGTITVYLSSHGGEVESGLAIFDAIKLARNKVRIIGTGPIMSMGGVILQAADERFLTPNARVLLHDGSGHLEDSLLKLKSLGKEAGATVDRMAQLIHDRSGVPLAKLLRLMTDETFLSAQEAAELNLCDGVVMPPPPPAIPKKSRR